MGSYTLSLLGIAAANLLAAASPGPAFLLVSRTAMTHGRSLALATGLGVASAAWSWAVAASLGLGVILIQAAWLYALLKLAGGLYLCWIGIQAIRHAREPMPEQGSGAGSVPGAARAWRRGYAAGMTNPKVIVFFGSIFLTLFAAETPVWVRIAALGIVACNEVLWYSLVATLFSRGPARRVYGRAKTWVDRISGAVMFGFGLRLISAARR